MSDFLTLLAADSSPKGSPRVTQAPVSALFPSRWSGRAFAETPVPEEVLSSIFEAARWAPSCFNAQPWRFLVADAPDRRDVFAGLLNEMNQSWAAAAPVLAFVLARRSFPANGKPNRWASFDCGAAWMALALQARIHGVVTHGMAGVDFDGVYATFDIDRDEEEVICAIAMGYPGDRDSLPEKLAEKEEPNGRKDLSEVWTRG